MKNDPSIAGSIFYRLTLLRPEAGRFWTCRCSCGSIVSKNFYDVTRGSIRSCGCLKSERTAERNKANATHGLTNTPTFTSWSMALNRCYNKNIPVYATYGAIGIRMCEYFRVSPWNLVDVIGFRPKGTSIDRFPNKSGHYSCGKCAECLERGWAMNVRWATSRQQGRNQKTNHIVTINGESLCLADWADRIGIKGDSFRLRLNRGWSGNELLLPPKTQIRTYRKKQQ